MRKIFKIDPVGFNIVIGVVGLLFAAAIIIKLITIII